VEHSPGEDAGRIEEQEVPRRQEEQAGHDEGVEPRHLTLRWVHRLRQVRFPSSGRTGRRVPQEHRTLLTAHSIFSSFPQFSQQM
jgi:hypothetical protein